MYCRVTRFHRSKSRAVWQSRRAGESFPRRGVEFRAAAADPEIKFPPGPAGNSQTNRWRSNQEQFEGGQRTARGGRARQAICILTLPDRSHRPIPSRRPGTYGLRERHQTGLLFRLDRDESLGDLISQV
jgi:hypothetical protein